MRNLIYTNMIRLKKSKLFWMGALSTIIYSAFLLIMNYRDLTISGGTAITHLNWYFFSSLLIVGAFCAVFSGMFIGTEYSNQTLRNKLIVGHTRKSIYMANFLTIFLANVLVFVAACLIVVIIGVPLFGWNLIHPMNFIWTFISGILMLASFAGLFTFISMLISNKAISVMTCMMTYVVLFIVGNILRLLILDYYVASSNIPNNIFTLTLEFFYDFLPICQSFQISSGIILHPLRLPIYSIINIILTTAFGVRIFTKKNLV